MHQALLEKVFYSDIIPSRQPTENHSECDDCFIQLQSMLSSEAQEKLEQYLTLENSKFTQQEVLAFISGCQFTFRFVTEFMK